MAPLPDNGIKSYVFSLLRRASNTLPPSKTSNLSPKALGLLARTKDLLPRATIKDPGAGVTPPDSIPNKAVFALFGLIGVGFVLTGIWFFFWAKNGGFYFKENDWEDYKSTVLRRKGPNGTTLSGATESTDLGGGSVVHGQSEKRSVWGRRKKGMKRYKDFDEEEGSEMTSSLGGSTLASEMGELKQKAKRKEKKERRKDKKNKKNAMSEVGTDIGTVDGEEELDVGVRDAVRAYRHEKPARVGGLNKESEASTWDGSTQDNSTAASELLSHREKTPTSTPTKIRKERKDTYTGGSGGIRKVVSTSEGTNHYYSPRSPSAQQPLIEDTATTHSSHHEYDRDHDHDHIKAEARRLQEKGRAATARRDFSFQAGDDSTVADSERSARREERERRRANRSPSKKVPGSYYEASEVGSTVSSDLGTKAYHHPIPGLTGGSTAAGGSTVGSDYAEERRKKRAGNGGGYRRAG